MIVSQCLQNQGEMITKNAEIKTINSFKVSVKLYLRLIIFKKIKINGKVKIIIPVGLIRKINPNESPAKEE